MTIDEFGSALAEFAPDDTKVVVTITSDRVVFSAIPRSKDSDSLPERQFSTNESEVAEDATIMRNALVELFPEQVKKILPDAKPLNAKEQESKRTSEKVNAEFVAEEVKRKFHELRDSEIKAGRLKPGPRSKAK